MSAIADHKARLAKAKTETPAPAPVDEARRLFTELGALLYMAAETDEVPDGSGYSDRLLRIAANLAEEAASESWIGRTFKEDGPHPWVDHKAFDIAALVAAAMNVPGDPCSDERSVLLSKIKPMLVELTECEACLNPESQGKPARFASGMGRKELEERLELATSAALEIQSWIAMIEPVAKQAILDAGMTGDLPDWHHLAPTVFARIQTLTSAIFYSQDTAELPTPQLHQCVWEGKSVEETHWEADLHERIQPRKEVAHG